MLMRTTTTKYSNQYKKLFFDNVTETKALTRKIFDKIWEYFLRYIEGFKKD